MDPMTSHDVTLLAFHSSITIKFSPFIAYKWRLHESWRWGKQTGGEQFVYQVIDCLLKCTFPFSKAHESNYDMISINILRTAQMLDARKHYLIRFQIIDIE
jgi:hypothetical protein